MLACGHVGTHACVCVFSAFLMKFLGFFSFKGALSFHLQFIQCDTCLCGYVEGAHTHTTQTSMHTQACTHTCMYT